MTSWLQCESLPIEMVCQFILGDCFFCSVFFCEKLDSQILKFKLIAEGKVPRFHAASSFIARGAELGQNLRPSMAAAQQYLWELTHHTCATLAYTAVCVEWVGGQNDFKGPHSLILNNTSLSNYTANAGEQTHFVRLSYGFIKNVQGLKGRVKLVNAPFRIIVRFVAEIWPDCRPSALWMLSQPKHKQPSL